SMDSANMHLASLVGTSVVSIWGATHPYAGFYGWHQLPDNAVQIDLPCRPCSVYGNRPCFRNDYACLNLISPDMVLERLEQALSRVAIGS
ncbi:MAG: glycosyl transferase family 1, partial [Bacteroidales bacterium]|nr:glycosyl transferase family 1 [Bacteroidales bacterium]